MISAKFRVHSNGMYRICGYVRHLSGSLALGQKKRLQIATVAHRLVGLRQITVNLNQVTTLSLWFCQLRRHGTINLMNFYRIYICRILCHIGKVPR